ncbi:MAG: PD40 domain-containing protein [Calditrichae bacterium]|nr:PD40 domain-containing protein [Calditrichia bacterium]
MNDLAFTPDGAYLISCAGSPDNTVKIWRFSNGYCQINQTLTPWGGDVNAISISADGRYLAAGGNYTAVKLWQLSSGSASALNDLRLQYYPVRDLQFSPDSKYLAIAGQGKQIEIWQMNGSGASRLKPWPMPRAASLPPFSISPSAATVNIWRREAPHPTPRSGNCPE